MNRELRKAENILGEYLATAQGKIDKQNGGKPQLAASQEAWLQYRKAECSDAYEYEERGSLRYLAELRCQLEATHSRTHAIWSTYIRGFGGEVPVLPEPDWHQNQTLVRVGSGRYNRSTNGRE
jgi:hypothetical protein